MTSANAGPSSLTLFGKESHSCCTNCKHIVCLGNDRQRKALTKSGFGAGKIRSSVRTSLQDLQVAYKSSRLASCGTAACVSLQQDVRLDSWFLLASFSRPGDIVRRARHCKVGLCCLQVWATSALTKCGSCHVIGTQSNWQLARLCHHPLNPASQLSQKLLTPTLGGAVA